MFGSRIIRLGDMLSEALVRRAADHRGIQHRSCELPSQQHIIRAFVDWGFASVELAEAWAGVVR